MWGVMTIAHLRLKVRVKGQYPGAYGHSNAVMQSVCRPSSIKDSFLVEIHENFVIRFLIDN